MNFCNSISVLRFVSKRRLVILPLIICVIILMYNTEYKQGPTYSFKKWNQNSNYSRKFDSYLGKKKVQNPNNEYRIYTKGCKIKTLPLFDNETIKLFENKTQLIWKCKPDTIHIKRFDETWIKLDSIKLDYIPFCYYRQLSRGKDDFHFNYGEFKGPIENSTINFREYDFVHIVCYKNRASKNYNIKNKDIIHDQIIPLLPIREKKTDSVGPSILLLAIDSMSYINFRRHFIRTKSFLDQKNFFELKGYNKVGLNTFPNMIPFLSGQHSWERSSYEELMKVKFDFWPLIWKHFSAKGFVTAFVEEMGEAGLFQFKGQGFKYRPTDYETRPFHMESQKLKYNQFCIRDRTETEHSLDWTYDFIKAMNKRHQKYFAYISISLMTHDWLNGGHYMDVPYQKFFTKIFKENLMGDTIIFFFSDHGLRFGPIMKTRIGEVEDRLPFMFIHVPDHFDNQYIDNLRMNQERLTTAFDIHATMVNLLNGKPNRTLLHGLSLIDQVISEDRDCDIASIPEQYCACYEDILETNLDIIKPNDTIPKIINRINWYSRQYRKDCTEYKFCSIKSLKRRKISQNTKIESRLYLVQIYVNPGMALFQTLIKGFESNTRFDIMGHINRINLYGNQSHCITHKFIKNFCFCKDLLKI